MKLFVQQHEVCAVSTVFVDLPDYILQWKGNYLQNASIWTAKNVKTGKRNEAIQHTKHVP